MADAELKLEEVRLSKWDTLLMFAGLIFIAGVALIILGMYSNQSDISTMGYGLCTTISGYYFAKRISDASH